MDTQQIRLLRSYSRLTILSTSSYNDGYSSASGLEKFLPRTSTPDPEKFVYVDNQDCFDSYEIFRHVLENPPKKVRVRGLKKIPFDFISGHLVEISNKFDITISLNSTQESLRERKSLLKLKFSNFRKRVRNFFKKCYKSLVRNKCDDSVCPATCECQKIKSLLNKTVFFEDDVNAVEDRTEKN